MARSISLPLVYTGSLARFLVTLRLNAHGYHKTTIREFEGKRKKPAIIFDLILRSGAV
ncbi:MAG: hypothetical protein ACREAB_15610 [Blastocatellia bacterium]